MHIYFSASTMGFYRDDIHGDAMPSDVVEVTPEQHEQLMTAQAAGQMIVVGEGGQPVAVDRPVQVPKSVSMRQARLALLNAGKLDAVTTAIANLPSPQKQAAQIEWDYASTVERDSPFLAQLSGLLGLDAEALDALFIGAVKL